MTALRRVLGILSLPIGWRLALAFGVVLALVAVAVNTGVRGLDTMFQAADTAFQNDVQLAGHASQMVRLMQAERRFEKEMILSLDTPAKIVEARKRWEEANKRLESNLRDARKVAHSPEDLRDLEEIGKQHAAYTAGLADVAGRIFDTLNTAAEINTAMEAFQSAVQALEVAGDRLNERSLGKLDKVREDLARTKDATRKGQIALLGMCLGVGAVFCLVITASITRPLRRAVQTSQAIAAGKFDNEISGGGRSETGELLKALAGMQERLLEAELNAKGQLAMISQMQAVAEYSPEGELRVANDNFVKVLGYAREEIIGKPHETFVDARTRASLEYGEFWPSLRRGTVAAGLFRRLRADGTELWLQGMYSPIHGADGKPFKVVCYLSDVTADRTAAVLNAAFRGALDRLDANVMVVDTERTIIYVNPAANRMFDAAAPDLRAYLPQFDAARLLGGHLDSLTGDPGRLRALVDALTATSTHDETIGGRQMRAILSPMLDAEQRRLGTVIEWFDRTQEVATENDLQSILASITDGSLDRRIALDGKTGVFKTLSLGINELVDTVSMLAEEIQSLVTVANNGDLTRRIDTNGKSGLLVRLGSGINELTSNMAGIVSHVKTAAADVHRGADEISKGNLHLSQRTEQQASSLEETASSMEEMTSSVKLNAENAQHANQLARAAHEQAEKGGAVVSRAVAAMGEINGASNKIAEIIGVIDEIAFQTNLLALNAAVEAARAGEQGRGFAVVATEVRNLAGRSATAAREIKALIQDSVSKVNEGSELVTQSGETLQQILAAVKKVTGIVGEIAVASSEQSAGIEQVNKAVMHLDELTQQNAALVEQASAASASMAEQARGLNDSMVRYKVAAAALRVVSSDGKSRRSG